ncbi:MAG: tRNA (N6-threonylcarbamoyladenosine(37)-N6)-methyltransferase TrmO [Candidatus Thiodiazotropha sp. (ex Monitilora ramsayi)]|nr:tRNA (N6-threonylcarbamoyladenosine(37)-N6)-methyltransferase TrmO [Candidatus Thiodiazotropha sp. (ex Monitilora ramsayi)]
MTHFDFQPIGTITSCFKEKFGIPRQSGLIPEARATLDILPPYNRPEAFRELAEYSHIWLTFVFHANIRENWKPTVRPPRLGGNQRVGVFASRSPFRPNPIGLSVVRLDQLDIDHSNIRLYLSGIDLLDGTPVLDIKPYLPYTDAIPDASAGYAPDPPGTPQKLTFEHQAEEVLNKLNELESAQLRKLIRQILEQDPRPGYRQGQPEKRYYGMRLFDYDIRWEIEQSGIRVTELVPFSTTCKSSS